MEHFGYMQISLTDILDAIIDKYHPRNIAQINIQKGMYGIPQAFYPRSAS